MGITVTVPPSTTKLTALADFKAILSITDSANDTLLGSIIQRGSDAMARFQSECLMASSRRLPPAKKDLREGRCDGTLVELTKRKKARFWQL
jgi:hypothetical protein